MLIPSFVVIIGLIVIAFVCAKTISPPIKPNLPNKSIDLSSSEINKDVNSGIINPRIKGGNSIVNI